MVVGAGQVFYNVTNFIEKNRDTLSSDIMAALQVTTIQQTPGAYQMLFNPWLKDTWH